MSLSFYLSLRYLFSVPALLLYPVFTQRVSFDFNNFSIPSLTQPVPTPYVYPLSKSEEKTIPGYPSGTSCSKNAKAVCLTLNQRKEENNQEKCNAS
ncbi:hypothetical protein M011DRAFT_198146 [Sporormia fimetaria CBS 119925]|uniref:Uncharacterized protein n=1 Tax=Sporormia fimetaria CBS 119925 TaxID=1340428 RepID=A0A6A6V3H2_9PLEO|nr:hypothetical protein M011DRAFT_198146 [Sporormia fimetaria CBS 119925]